MEPEFDTMTIQAKTLRVCKNGHRYYKSSDCPVCPICAQENQPAEGLLSRLGAPARRALQNAGIQTEEQLARFSQKEILALHGMGPASIPILIEALKRKGMQFRQ